MISTRKIYPPSFSKISAPHSLNVLTSLPEYSTASSIKYLKTEYYEPDTPQFINCCVSGSLLFNTEITNHNSYCYKQRNVQVLSEQMLDFTGVSGTQFLSLHLLYIISSNKNSDFFLYISTHSPNKPKYF